MDTSKEIIKIVAGLIAVVFFIGCTGSRSAHIVPGNHGDTDQNRTGFFTDERDHHTYKTITIGDVEWMAENFSYETEAGSRAYRGKYDSPANEHKRCVKKYGLLYTWDAAVSACPKGWRLPTYEECLYLIRSAGETSKERYSNLKYGRNAAMMLQFGGQYFGWSQGIGREGYYWTGTKSKTCSEPGMCYMSLCINKGLKSVYLEGVWPRGTYHSVRYVRDSADS